jgi:glycine/D-amino acid oxidase-like deaminating enzyme
MHVDYIIVGLGLAGLAFAEVLKEQQRSFVVYEDNSQNSSLVAGGMYNPVVLKRFTPVWNAKEQLNMALPFYEKLEKKFNAKYNYRVDICRVFKSVEEQNNWFLASDKLLLQDYMLAKIIKNENINIRAPFDLGKLNNTGRIDVKTLVRDYKTYLKKHKILIEEKFDHNKIEFNNKEIRYKNRRSGKIVFCEGYGLKDNTFFNYLPMREAKGELLTIYAPELRVDYLVKSAVFVLPMGNDLYKVGATFNWTDKTKSPTKEGRQELEFKLKSVINCNYKVVDHTAGIRPTIKDRRPLVGIHPDYKQLAILNGLGTRGVMIAPLMAQKLYNHIENDELLEKEISIERFE